jgi:asparagine synthase (glutamine-hydrolysing)
MCGIAAIVGPLAREERGARVRRMLRALRHRGPDGHGSWSDARASFGHVRLRVVDPSARADQPFLDPGPGSPVLLFNGELYNYRALRKELEGYGERFRTQSDTEVLYRALLVWGEQALVRLSGMFALVWYEPARNRLLLARDGVGIKPLYFAEGSGCILVSSEVSGIVAADLVPLALDPQCIFQVARFNHPIATRTAHQHVHALAPGQAITLDLGTGAKLERSFFRVHDTTVAKTYGERVEQLDALFVEAVQMQTPRDQSSAVYLSGGLDSSGILAEAQRHGDCVAYSLEFPGARCDETDAINRTVAALKVASKRVPIAELRFDDYVSYIRHAELPQLWTTDAALLLLARAVREGGQRVVLSGEGPDEIFAGYDSFRLQRIRSTLPTFALNVLQHSASLAERAKGSSWFEVDASLIQLYADAHLQAPAKSVYGFHPENLPFWSLVENTCAQVFTPDFRSHFPSFDAQAKTSVASKMLEWASASTSGLSANLWFEYAVRLPNWVLHMSDRMSSAQGLELRVPYLDEQLVRFALALPDSDRIRFLEGKRILRAAHRRRLPKAVWSRPKQPLYTPIYEWIHGFFAHPEFQDCMRAPTTEYFDAKEIRILADCVEHGQFSSLRDKMAKEWSLLLVTSTELLARHWKAVRDAKGEV